MKLLEVGTNQVSTGYKLEISIGSIMKTGDNWSKVISKIGPSSQIECWENDLDDT